MEPNGPCFAHPIAWNADRFHTSKLFRLSRDGWLVRSRHLSLLGFIDERMENYRESQSLWCLIVHDALKSETAVVKGMIDVLAFGKNWMCRDL